MPWYDPSTWTDETEGIDGAFRDNVSSLPASVVNGIIANLLELRTGADLPEIPEDMLDYALYGRNRPGTGGGLDPIRFWRRPRELPTTPGTQSGIGRPLVVTGEGERDWRWGQVGTQGYADGSIRLRHLGQAVQDAIGAGVSPEQIAAAVAAYLRANPPGAEDAQARAGVVENAAAIARKQDALTTAQVLGLLQFDVIPSVIQGYTADDITLDWRLWVSGGDTVGDVWCEMQLEGQSLLAAPPPSTPGADLHRHKLSAQNTYQYSLATSLRDNLVAGRTARRQGRDVEVDLRFFDADRAGTLLDIVTIAVDWIAADQGPKGNPGTSITLTRYANEAAVPANVPANTVAWWPAS